MTDASEIREITRRAADQERRRVAMEHACRNVSTEDLCTLALTGGVENLLKKADAMTTAIKSAAKTFAPFQ